MFVAVGLFTTPSQARPSGQKAAIRELWALGRALGTGDHPGLGGHRFVDENFEADMCRGDFCWGFWTISRFGF